MTTEITNPSPTFVFWLFNWATHRIFTSLHYYPRYIRCDIDENGISVYDLTNPVRIPYAQIKSCELYRFSQGRYAGPTNNVKLKLIKSVTTNEQTVLSDELYLVPMNVFRNEPRTAEMEDMVYIITSFRSGNVPLLPTSPYERELIRLGKANEFDAKRWDSLTRPDEYTPVPNPFLFLLKLLLFVVVGTLAISVVIGIIYNLLY